MLSVDRCYTSESSGMPNLGRLILVFPGLLAAGEWPQFRGPLGSGIAETSALPQTFDPRTVCLVSEACAVSIVSPGGERETVRVNLLEDKCVATPAIADGRLFIRTETTLCAFGKQ